jgi:hypothetical protein
MSNRADWSGRHASTQHIMRFFDYDHLPPGVPRQTSLLCAELAELLLLSIGDGPELSAGMRKLLEAKDCFVRAALPDVSS